MGGHTIGTWPLSKWAAVVKRSRELAETLPDNMERVRQDVLFAWNKARVNIGRS